MQRFAHELRKLREETNGLTYRAMARGVPYAVTTLSRAAAGEQLPSLAVTLAYVQACGGDAGEWERRWHEAEEECAARNSPDDDSESPYQGLARFEPADHDRFFGRDKLVGTARDLVSCNRFTAVFGPSGSGKSSLLRAGLVPTLRKGSHGLAAIRILTPGEHPLRTHTAVLVPKETGTDGGPQGDTLIVVDQFEEVFTLCTDPTERNGFIDRLLTAQNPDSRLRVIIAVRADFYSRCAGHRGLADALTDTSLMVGPMTPAELRETIVGPAQRAGLIVERELTARLVSEVEGEPGGLPLLSHVLRETWRRRRGRTLTLAAYEDAGGTHGAIARTAENIYAGLSNERQHLARLVLLRMITPGDGTPDTRRPVTRTELDFGDPAETTLVVERLARARLLTLDDTTVDLAHEALITAWPRLNTWIEEARERLRAHRHLTEATHTWTDLGHDPGGLYRGARLTIAEDHFTPPGKAADLTPPEQAFLTASRTARTRDTRRRRTLLTTLALVMGLALTAGAVAWQQNRTSSRRHIDAEARRIAAVANSLRYADPKAAQRLSVAAWHLADTTETRSAVLGAMAQREQDVLAIPDTDPTTGERHLSLDGRTLVSVERDRITIWDLRAPSSPRTYPGLGKRYEGAPFTLSPDGRSIALPRKDGVLLWDIRTGRVNGRLGVVLPLRAVFSRDGRTLAVKRDDADLKPAVEVWNVRDQRRLLRIPPRAGGEDVAHTALSGDGRQLALCSGSDPLEIWDIARRTKRSPPWGKRIRGDVCTRGDFSFAPDGRTAALVTGSGVQQWDLRSGQAMPELAAEGLEILRFAPDSEFLAASSAGELLIWRRSAPTAPVFRHELVRHTALDLALDPGAGMLRYLNASEASVRSLSLGRATTQNWSKSPFAQAGLSEDGRTLALLRQPGGEKGILLLDTRSGRIIGNPPGEPCDPTPPESTRKVCSDLIAFSANGRYFAHGKTFTAGDAWPLGDPAAPSRRITVWDVAARREHTTVDIGLDRLTESGDPPLYGAHGATGLILSADGYKMFVSRVTEARQSTEIWDTARKSSARKLREIPGVAGESLALRRDSGKLITSSGAVVSPGQGPVERRVLADNEARILTYSRQGTYLAVGDILGRVTVWDGELRRRLAALSGARTVGRERDSSAGTTALAFSSDGTMLAVADETGSLQLWHVPSSQPLGSPLPTPGDPVLSLAFGADGNTLYTVGRHTGLQEYDIHPGRLAADLCDRTGSGLAAEEWEDHLPDLPYRKVC
ncbi:nSTAND1 domain-containing NTPase [Streptomyces yaizuensis]|uniref:DNA-binding protein n=1 Tax=Streptomyces yaizuensis TaxID=2989713 RepID=A0ABQ5PBF6_9ACTN|nr:DNA-binding protein [Streptomyces sp. YSPA8]GLF99909.1 DNA-binding protein [Streptomyces sp. YSPA8]